MTAIRVAINGFDRLGRSVCKIAHDRNDVDIVAIRDTRDAETCAYLLKHDSIYGGYTRAVAAGENKITIGDDSVDILEESSPLKDVWGERKIDVVIDTTGADSATLRKHISAGARQVVALPHLEVVRVMCRCDLYTSCSKLLVNIWICDNRDLSVCKWQLQHLSYYICVSLIVRIYCNGCIAQ